MEAKDTVMKGEKIASTLGRCMDWDEFCDSEQIELLRLVQTQAKDTYHVAFNAGDEQGYKRGRDFMVKEVKEWSKEPCPHGVTKHTKQYAKRDCPECWQAFLKGLEGDK
jgi:hypothetical protein